ncbi:hypothetical protein [Gephyromycinifex aptenodytis]|uniref:hypothetical protein n=1 Tax=Gephyromycinifex aptenodytis TaxID=2716227 RepID=UPI001444B7E4|nr:hypothetical protein [Gephyromycinifex aptenodytis]
MSLPTAPTSEIGPQHHGFAGPIRLSRYTQPHDVLSLTEELVHLETQARIPADMDLTWLAPTLQKPGLELITASVGGRLVGFIAANLGQDIEMARMVIASAALEAHPQLPVVLIDTVLGDCEHPWADVIAPRNFSGLPILLAQRWHPCPERDGMRENVRLSAAHLGEE